MSTENIIKKEVVIDSRREMAELLLLRERLRSENECKLLAQIAICQTPLLLKCMSCRATKTVRQRCKRRWCPCCSKALAAARATEMEFIVERMRWPLFVTLTMRHGSTPSSGDVRTLRRAFGKLRNQRVWKERTKGGVASVEITNDEGGWHPHLHAVIDCQWLGFKVRPPPQSMPREQKKIRYKEASIELGKHWSKLLGQPAASVRVKRANKRTIAVEVTKYTVKNEDLVMCKGSAGDLIRAIDKTRMMTTFGEAHGMKTAGIRRLAKEYAKAKRAEWQEAMQEFDCCPAVDFMPEKMADNGPFISQMQNRRVVTCEPETRRKAIAAAIAA